MIKNTEGTFSIYVSDTSTGLGVNGISDVGHWNSIKLLQDNTLGADIKGSVTLADNSGGYYSFTGTQAMWNYDDVQCVAVPSGAAYQAYSPMVYTEQGLIASGVDVNSINGDFSSASNLSDTYNGTGYTNDFAPAQQVQLNQLSIVGGAVNAPASGFTLVTGTGISGSYTDTISRDGVEHRIGSSGNELNYYYELNIGGDAIPTSATSFGYLNGGNDDISMIAYNWADDNWDIIGPVNGRNNDNEQEWSYALFTSHVGTGVDKGEVRIGFSGDGLSDADLYVDQFYTSYAIVSRTVGYADGAVWVDTVDGTNGTESYVNGTADNPVKTWEEAQTVATNVGLSRYRIGNNSMITLDDNSDNYTLEGNSWHLDTNNKSCDSSYFHGATVNGVFTNSENQTEFDDCKLEVISGHPMLAHNCQIAGDITILESGNYYYNDCVSAVAGTSSPTFDFGATVADTNVNFRRYAGGLRVYNVGASGIDNMSLEGHGQLKIDESCVSGTIALRGHFKITDYASGVVNLSDAANFVSTVIQAGTAAGSGNGYNQIELDSRASSAPGAYDPAEIYIVAGTGAGQTRLIYEYNGDTKTATLDRNWKIQPVAGDSIYRVSSHPGREHVNEGLCASGSTTWAALNALASTQDDAYNYQTIFFRGGAGEDQVAQISDYDGEHQIATFEEPVQIAIDNTTSYVILPTHIHTPEEVAEAVETQTASRDSYLVYASGQLEDVATETKATENFDDIIEKIDVEIDSLDASVDTVSGNIDNLLLSGMAYWTTATAVTTTDLTTSALSQIVASGDASTAGTGWGATGSSTLTSGIVQGIVDTHDTNIVAQTDVLEGHLDIQDDNLGDMELDIASMVNNGVFASGIASDALSQIVASGNAAGWNSSSSGIWETDISGITAAGTPGQKLNNIHNVHLGSAQIAQVSGMYYLNIYDTDTPTGSPVFSTKLLNSAGGAPTVSTTSITGRNRISE